MLRHRYTYYKVYKEIPVCFIAGIKVACVIACSATEQPQQSRLTEKVRQMSSTFTSVNRSFWKGRLTNFLLFQSKLWFLSEVAARSEGKWRTLWTGLPDSSLPLGLS